MFCLTEKKWISKNVSEEEVLKLSKEASVSRLMAKVFTGRGMNDPKVVKTFLNPEISDLHDPFLLKDMDKAVDRIIQAVDEKQKITVYGDYDVDGITSTSILYNFLLRLGAISDFFIPDRNGDGYGLSINSIKKIINNGTKLIISVDCGVTAIEEVDYINKHGAQIVITDHHRCIDILPDAYAVVDTCRPDCNYPYKHLCGAGVAYKIITAICIKKNLGDIYNEYLDLVALGTVADVVPLIGENRIIVKHGLDLMLNTNNLGLKTLIADCDIKNKQNKPLSTQNISYILAPRINAAGRIGDAGRAVDLFTTKNIKEAKEIVTVLNEENKYRQAAEMEILEEAVDIIESDPSYKEKKVLIVSSEGWHHGIIGIVASRIKEKYYKPCILISFEKGMGKGSGRSVDGFNLFDALSNFDDLLVSFGGHELAAGLSIKKDNIKKFEEEINCYANENFDEDVFIPKLKYDCQISKDEISIENVNELELLEPYGAGNPKPSFSYKKLRINDIRAVGEDKHLKIAFKDNDFSIDSIAFNMGILKNELAVNDIVDSIFAVEINYWNSIEKLQLNLKDIHFSDDEINEKQYSQSFNESMNEYLNDTTTLNKEYNELKDNLNRISLKTFIESSKRDKKTAIFIDSKSNLETIKNEIEISDIKKKIKICYTECYNADKDKITVLVNPLYKNLKNGTFDEIAISENYIDNSFISRMLKEKKIDNACFIDVTDEIHSVDQDEVSIDRNDLVSVYQYLKSKKQEILIIDDIFGFSNSISKSYKIRMNIFKLMKSFEIFRELEILDFKEIGNNKLEMKVLNEDGKKVNLENSKILKSIRSIKK